MFLWGLSEDEADALFSTDKLVFKCPIVTMFSFVSCMHFFVNDFKLCFNITRDRNIYFSKTLQSSCFPTIFDGTSTYWEHQETSSCLK